MNCAVLAEGIITAARDFNIQVPLVVRMEGTNSEQGRKMLRESGLAITAAEGLADGAQKVVEVGS